MRERNRNYRAAVLTVSDRSYRGERPDETGPAVLRLLEEAGYEAVSCEIVPDEQPEIEAALRRIAGGGDVSLAVTAG